jgi:excisionase family DNA binding protein
MDPMKEDNMSHHNVEPLIDAKVAGKLLHLHPRTVKRMAAEKELPALRIGNRWRFRASELDAWATAQLQSNCHLRPPHEEDIR